MSMFQQAALFLNEDMYHEFKIALALGHWRNGDKLTPHQRKICQEVVSIREAFSFEQPETEELIVHEVLQPNLIDDAYMPSVTWQ